MGSLERLLGRLEVTLAKPDLADLVLGEAEVENVSPHLLASGARVRLGLVPRATPAQNARSVDAAVAGGRDDALADAAPLRGDRPLPRAPVVAKLAADGQRLAVDEAGRPRPERSAHRGGHRLVDLLHGLVDTSEPDQGASL